MAQPPARCVGCRQCPVLGASRARWTRCGSCCKMPAGRRFLHSWPPGQLWAEGTARRYDANGKSVYAFTVSEKPC